jgi:hypothetical protein
VERVEEKRAPCGGDDDGGRRVNCAALARACRDKDQLGLRRVGVRKTFRNRYDEIIPKPEAGASTAFYFHVPA